MSTDGDISSNNPFEKFQKAAAAKDEANGVIYTVQIEVKSGRTFDSVTITFTNILGKPAGTLTGQLIPPGLASGTYSGNAAFAGTVASYVGETIIGLATQVKGENGIAFTTTATPIGLVTSQNLAVSCAAGLFKAAAAS